MISPQESWWIYFPTEIGGDILLDRNIGMNQKQLEIFTEVVGWFLW